MSDVGSDYNSLIVICSDPNRPFAAMDSVRNSLPPEIEKRWSIIGLRYCQLYGPEGLCERINNRTVGQILAEFDPALAPGPIAAGTVDDVSYELYGAPEKRE